MPRKKKSNGNQGKATTLVFPTHAEIEETLMRRIGFWEHPDRKGPYPLPVLNFLINAIGCEIETGEGGEEFAKDAEFYNPHWYTVRHELYNASDCRRREAKETGIMERM